MSEIMRIQKYLSQSGICSRRKAEEYIKNGQIFINWNIAEIGMSINPEKDIVTLWEKAVEKQENFVYYLYNKPRGIETTCAQKGGTSIIDVINVQERVFPVWRLDKESTGLILLTNDGRMTNYLTHPRYKHEKEYVVEVFWPIDDASLSTMSQWVQVLWSLTQPCTIERIAAWKFSIILTEWRNRQIRRMVETVGYKVKKLKRVRIENLYLWKLNPWSLRPMLASEKKVLFASLWLTL